MKLGEGEWRGTKGVPRVEGSLRDKGCLVLGEELRGEGGTKTENGWCLRVPHPEEGMTGKEFEGTIAKEPDILFKRRKFLMLAY